MWHQNQLRCVFVVYGYGCYECDQQALGAAPKIAWESLPYWEMLTLKMTPAIVVPVL